MNDGARIVELENTPEALEMLGAQRELYRRAKTYQYVAWALGVVVPIMVTLMELILSWQIPSQATIAIEMGLFVGVALAQKKKSSLVEDAAAVQQRFDSKVYGIYFDHVYRDDAEITTLSKMDSGLTYVGRPLEDWYDAGIVGLAPSQAIARCQRINATWSGDLSRLTLRMAFLAIVAGLAFVIWATLGRGADLANLCLGFTFIESLIEICWDAADNAKAKGLITLSCSGYDLADERNIRMVQDHILEYRRNPSILVPDAFYTIRRKLDAQQVSAIAFARDHGGAR